MIICMNNFNLEEMEKNLEKYNLLRMNQKEIEN
jgi:hypothetical protein